MILVPFLVVFLLTGWGGEANRWICLAIFVVRDLLLEFHQFVSAFFFHFFRNLVCHLCCRGILLRRVSEDTETVKFHLIYELLQFFMIFLRLPRKSGDQSCT